jgi:hypothetical protein
MLIHVFAGFLVDPLKLCVYMRQNEEVNGTS